jgi:hypothetical protein
MLDPTERAAVAQSVGVARMALDAAAFTAAWTAGQAMVLEQAIASALEDDPASH